MRAETAIQLSGVSLAFLVAQFGILYIFPILPDITHDFFPELKESELGFRQGYLAGIYFLGNFCGSLFWGKVSDRIGRKRALMCTTCLFSILITVFGLSTSYAMALITRFLWGILNGTDPIVKTYIAEICEDKKDLARGISFIGLTDGVGRLIGPTISAWLSKPATKFSFLNNSLLRRFPYLLPSLVCTSLGCVSVATSYLVLKETVGRNLGREGEGEYEKLNQTVPKETQRSSAYSSIRKFIKVTSHLFTRRIILAAIFNYNYYAFVIIQFDELIPLMLVTPPKYGGFCMNENSLGFVTFCTSLLQIPWSLLIVPMVITRFGIRRCFRFGLIVTAILVFCLPLWTRNSFVEQSFSNYNWNYTSHNSSLLNASDSSAIESCGRESLGIADIAPAIWLILFSIQIPISLLRILLFAGYTIGVANCSIREHRATVNGVAQSGASIMRLIGPIVGANVYAWSISIELKWPIDATLIWSLASIQLILLSLTSFLYPPQIEHPQD